jgi:preprotein translocase subunit SecG
MELLLMILLFLTASFLILLVLVQRGRGGGLAGAFGGLGGQSAFGTKAGDLFTRITIGVAAFWIILCAFSVWYFSVGSGSIISQQLGRGATPSPMTGPADVPKDSKAAPATPQSKSAPGKQEAPPSAAQGAKTDAPTTTPAPAIDAPPASTPEKTP